MGALAEDGNRDRGALKRSVLLQKTAVFCSKTEDSKITYLDPMLAATSKKLFMVAVLGNTQYQFLQLFFEASLVQQFFKNLFAVPLEVFRNVVNNS